MSNDLLDTKTVNLTEIIGNGKKYKVPSFQRDYSWLEGEWEDLWLDIIEIYENNITHYMGAIVLQKKEDETFFLIDGQQRITTLSIFIIALVQFLENLSSNGIDKEKNKERAKIIKRNFIGDKDASSLLYSSKFETLNSRGVELTTTDLLKNFLFSKVAESPNDDEWKNDRFNKYYKEIEKYIGEFNLYGIKIARSLLLAGYKYFNENEFVKLLKLTSLDEKYKYRNFTIKYFGFFSFTCSI